MHLLIIFQKSRKWKKASTIKLQHVLNDIGWSSFWTSLKTSQKTSTKIWIITLNTTFSTNKSNTNWTWTAFSKKATRNAFLWIKSSFSIFSARIAKEWTIFSKRKMYKIYFLFLIFYIFIFRKCLIT